MEKWLQKPLPWLKRTEDIRTTGIFKQNKGLVEPVTVFELGESVSYPQLSTHSHVYYGHRVPSVAFWYLPVVMVGSARIY